MSAAMSPVNVLIPIIFIFAALVVAKYQPVQVEVKIKEGDVFLKRFTNEEIAKYDGSNPDLPIYLGMKGVVFDVSKGKGFYSKGSDYNKLVGKDASRGHALWSLEDKDLSHDLSGLTDDQLEGLDQIFQGTYMAKYPVVGYMDFLIDQQPPEIRDKFYGKDEL